VVLELGGTRPGNQYLSATESAVYAVCHLFCFVSCTGARKDCAGIESKDASDIYCLRDAIYYYASIHLQYLGVTPYAHHMKRYRGKRLVDAFPQYNENLLYAYSDSAPMYNPKDLWI